MPRTIESELHDILLELAPDTDQEEQAMIVAQASDIYRDTSKRTAHRLRQGDAHEARLMDSLLQAMGRLAEWSEDEDDAGEDYVGLTPDQIVYRISSAPKRPQGKGGFGEHMDILNDDDLDIFLHPEKIGPDSDEEWLDDTYIGHCPELFRPKGRGRHRTDSLGR